MTGMGRLLRAWLCLPLLALSLLAALTGTARAHAEFRGSTPPAEAVVSALPPEVLLDFSEPVGPLALLWLLPDGRRVEASAEARPGGLRVTPPPATGQGSYVLNWRVASSDGHPVGGALVFALDHPGGQATAPDAPSDMAGPAVAARLLALLAMILPLGAALYAAFIAPLSPRAARRAWIAAALSLPLSLLALGAYGLDLLGEGPAALLGVAPWRAAISQPRGWGLLLGVVAALLALAGLRGEKPVVLVAVFLAALALSISGHAAAGAHAAIGQPLMAAHAVALIFWLGGMPALLAGLRAPDALAALRRFSALALPAVMVLAVSGISLILLRGVGWQALAASNWGKLLAVKLALVVAMLGLAARNRFVLTPQLAEGRAGAEVRLARSIGVEIGFGVLVLACALSFRLTPPPNPAPPEPTPVQLHLHGNLSMADVEMRSTPPGPVSFALLPYDADGAPFTPREMRLSFQDKAAGIGPIRVEATRPAETGGGWQAGPVTLPTPGPWEVVLTVLIDDFTEEKLGVTLPVAGSPH